MTPTNIPSAHDIVRQDLDNISRRLDTEFAAMSGGTLLITGAAGFLGYYLVQSALHWNHTHPESGPIRLIACDNFMRGVPGWLTALYRDPALTLLRHDVTLPLPDHTGPLDYIMHAASIASPFHYRMHPIRTMDANVGGLRMLLDRCLTQQEAGHPVSGFLFFSTSEIYGDPTPENIPTPDSYRGNVSCTGPRACYDESKRFGETLCVNFARNHGIRANCVRPFNNYGPGLKITDRRAIPDFARDLLCGKDLVVLSDGSPTRTFCYSADAVVGYYKILVRGRAGEAYNIGTETPEISILALARMLSDTARDLFGCNGAVVHRESSDMEYLTDNPQRRCPVISKARTELDYEPEIPLEAGIRRTMIWYNENRNAEEA
jgi:nucleoside-diphosphate-sugar epimerase